MPNVDRLTPEQLRTELDRWFAGASLFEQTRFSEGARTVTLSDSSSVKLDGTPGFLIVDGVRMYSAAWL